MIETKTILVIEDNELNLKLVQSLLKIGGCRVMAAPDAENGIEMARQQPPDLILMDLQLPGMNGLSATRMLKEDPDLGRIPVVALTSYAMQGDREKALAAGCNGYISKPLDTRSFMDSLKPHLENGSEKPASGQNTVHRPRILIVDDEPMNVKLLAAKLGPGKYDILKANDGASALRIANQTPPDLILLDIMMPGLNGYEVAAKLKENPPTHHIPIIMVTALSELDDRIRGLEAGADEFLTKPVDSAELQARVSSMLRIKQYQEQLALRSESEKGFFSDRADLVKPDTAQTRRPVLLVVEDDPADLKLITRHLQNEPYALCIARDGAEALELACERRPDLILLDILLPDLDGFQLAARIKAHDATRDLQIIMITALDDLDSRIKGLETGGDDFLVKPINPRELRTRVKTLLRKKHYLDRLRTQYDLAVHSALTDGLTGLYNQSYFKNFLDLELKRASRNNYPLSLMMIDIDNFKQINDRFGHAAGDCILRELAGVLKENVREIDLAARYGGEEFAVVLPYADYDAARQVAKKLQARIRAYRFFHEKEPDAGKLTVSIGVALSPIDSEFCDALLRTADQRLYWAKKAGKNRICAVSKCESQLPGSTVWNTTG